MVIGGKLVTERPGWPHLGGWQTYVLSDTTYVPAVMTWRGMMPFDIE